MAHRTSPRAIYCSQQCRDWKRHHPDEPLNRDAHRCRYCDKPLDPQRLDLRYCRYVCQMRHNKGVARVPDTRECKACGASFAVAHGHQVYCTPECRDSAFFADYYQRNAEKIREAVREYRLRTGKGTEAVHRYQARKRAGEYERFNNREIFERDGWICQICGDPVDKDLSWPDVMSASLDHVVPVSPGGSHTRANTQLAHLTCNIKKSNKVSDRAVRS